MITRLFAAVALLCVSLVAPAQVTVSPILQPHQTFVDQAGAPCAGCALFSYTAGTTIATPTYQDASGSVPNTNPVVLSVQGGANIWVDTSKAYKFVLKNTQGTTLWTVDNVTSANAGAILSNPSGSQTITQPSGSDLNVNTSGGGKFNYNGSEIMTAATGTPAGSAVLLAPTANQTVTQPAGTTLAVNSLNAQQVASTATTPIQNSVTQAGTTGSVKIRPDYTPTDTYSNPNGLSIEDQRLQTDELKRITAFMGPWLNKLGAGSGANMNTLVKCIVASSCVIVGIGNSILDGGQSAYENSVFVQFMDAMEARFGHIFTWYPLGLPARSVRNYVNSYTQLPICPTNTPACATAVASAPFASFNYNAAFGYYFPPTSNLNATYGQPFAGADRKPWPNWPATNFTEWHTYPTTLNPDAVLFLFSMNDEDTTGATFTANMKAAIAPYLSLPKVPSIILVTGPNGSISPSGLAVFTPTKYAHLDEFGEDLRGLAEQNSYGLIDAARIFSMMRDGSDPVSTLFESDANSFLNFATNWALVPGSSPITVTGTGTGSSVVAGAISSQNVAQAYRNIIARDVVIAATWNTTDPGAIPSIQWRAPTDLSSQGYQAYLKNNGDGTGTVTVYSVGGGGTGIATGGVTGLTNTTSFMVQSQDSKYYVWVNGKLIVWGFDYDFIGYGYAGVGAVAKASGTPFTTSISYLTIETGSPLKSCATPIANKQAPPPCAPAYTTDQSLYGYAVDWGNNPTSMGGNLINHPTILGTFATYGVAMVPLMDRISSGVSSRILINIANTWTAPQTFPAGSGMQDVVDPLSQSYWTKTAPGTGIPANRPCWISHMNAGSGGAYAEADCVYPGGTGGGGYQRYISPGTHPIGSEVWVLTQQDDGGQETFPSLAGSGKALACVDPNGRLYRGTATTCP